MKVIQDDTSRWKDKMYSWIERFNIVKNNHTTQDNLQSQCNLYQIASGIFYKTRTKKLKKNCMETEKTANSQNNLEKEHSWRNHSPWFQTILQRHSNEKVCYCHRNQTNRLMEQDKKPRYKPMHLWTVNLRQKR